MSVDTQHGFISWVVKRPYAFETGLRHLYGGNLRQRKQVPCGHCAGFACACCLVAAHCGLACSRHAKKKRLDDTMVTIVCEFDNTSVVDGEC